MKKQKSFLRRNRVLTFSITFICVCALIGTAADLSKKKLVTKEERMIELANSPVRILLKGNDTYRISLDGKNFSRELPRQQKIGLCGLGIDPLKNPPRATAHPLSERGHNGINLYIVQCVTQPIEVFQKQITAAGGEICGTLPGQSLIVAMSAGTGSEVKAMPFVRWMGPYLAEYKIQLGQEKNLARAMGTSKRPIKVLKNFWTIISSEFRVRCS